MGMHIIGLSPAISRLSCHPMVSNSVFMFETPYKEDILYFSLGNQFCLFLYNYHAWAAVCEKLQTTYDQCPSTAHISRNRIGF